MRFLFMFMFLFAHLYTNPQSANLRGGLWCFHPCNCMSLSDSNWSVDSDLLSRHPRSIFDLHKTYSDCNVFQTGSRKISGKI